MIDLDVDHNFTKDNQGSLSIDSSFLNIQFNPEETVEEYVNQIVSVVVEDVELRLEIHKL